MLVSLGSLLAMAAIALAAFGVGRWLLRLLGIAARDPLATAVWSVAAGLWVWGHALLLLGACGALNAEIITAATVVAAGCGAVEMLIVWVPAPPRPAALDPSIAEASSVEEMVAPIGSVAWRVILAAAAVAGVVLLAASLAPPISADAVPQLEVPKRWLVDGHATLAAGDTACDWLLPQAWSVWGLALAGGEGARMVGYLLGMLFAASAAVWAAPFLGRRAACAVAALVLLSPGVLQQVAVLHPAVPATALCMLAAAAWYQACEQRLSTGWAIAAGVAVGALLSGAGLPALLLFVLLALTRASTQLRGGLAATADEVEPRHGRPWHLLLAAALFAAGLNGLPHWLLPRELALCDGLETVAWPIGGVTVVMVVLLPGLLWAGLPEKLRSAWVAVPAYILFLLPIMAWPAVHLVLVPLVATAAVWVLQELWRLPVGPRRVVVAAISVGAAATLAVPVAQLSRSLTAIWTADARDEYLSDREPLWPAAVVANCVLPPQAHVLSQADGAFHFDRRVTTAASLGQWIAGQGSDPSQWAARLRAAGFTHVLLIDSCAANDETLTLTEYDHSGHRYRLVKLP